MIDIITIKGDLWSYDPENIRIFKDGKLVSSDEAEPVFNDTDTEEPGFSGIYLKTTNQIISRSGKVNTIDNPNNIE